MGILFNTTTESHHRRRPVEQFKWLKTSRTARAVDAISKNIFRFGIILRHPHHKVSRNTMHSRRRRQRRYRLLFYERDQMVCQDCAFQNAALKITPKQNIRVRGHSSVKKDSMVKEWTSSGKFCNEKFVAYAWKAQNFSLSKIKFYSPKLAGVN